MDVDFTLSFNATLTWNWGNVCTRKAYLPNIIPTRENKARWKGRENYGKTEREGSPSLQNLLKPLTS